MRKLVRNALVAGAATTAAVGLAGIPAFADTAAWDINPNGTAFSATSTNSKLTNPRNNASLTCTSVTANGTTPLTDPNDAGSVHAPTGSVGHIDVADTVFPITSSSWVNCRGPFNLTFSVTQVGTWYVGAITENLLSHVVAGRISNITADIVGTGCSATVTGSVRGTYDNSTKTLTISEPASGGLTVTAASCLGILNVGDLPAFSATFVVSGTGFTIHRGH